MQSQQSKKGKTADLLKLAEKRLQITIIPETLKSAWSNILDAFLNNWLSLKESPDLYSYGEKLLRLMWNNPKIIKNPEQVKHIKQACTLFLKEKELDDLEKQLKAAGGSLSPLQTGDRLVLPQVLSELNKNSAIENRIGTIEKAIKAAKKELLLSTLHNGILKELYDKVKSSHKKLNEINDNLQGIHDDFFNTVQNFLYAQIELADEKRDSKAIENYNQLLQSVEKLADSLHEFNPDKYDTLEVKNYCSNKKPSQDPISEIFTKAKSVDPNNELTAFIAEIDKVSFFMQQIKGVQINLGTLQSCIEEMLNLQGKTLFLKKFEEQKLIIAQLKSTDSDLQQKTQEIQKALGRLEKIGASFVKLFKHDDSGVQLEDEADEGTLEVLGALQKTLETPDLTADAKIIQNINEIMEERAEKAQLKKEQETLESTKKVLEDIEKNKKEFDAVSAKLKDFLFKNEPNKKLTEVQPEREALEKLLYKIETIKTTYADITKQHEENEDSEDEEKNPSQQIKKLEEEAKKLLKEINNLETEIEKRERIEREAPEKARAYARLACAVNTVNKALKGNFVGASEFEQQCGITKRTVVEKGENRNIWSIFNALLQTDNIKKLIFDENNKAEIVVEIYGRFFKVTLNKATNPDTKTIIPNAYDVQLQLYHTTPPDGKINLDKEIFETPIRISKQGNLLIATDSKTKTEIVRDQYVDYDHQIDAMLSTLGLEMRADGKILPVSVPLPNLSKEYPAGAPQLIVAGTASGKSGIISTTAMVRGRGIFATQSGALVDGLVKDINDFIKNKDKTPAAIKFPENPNQPLPKESVLKFLDEHPYTVMSHEQLLLYADVLKERDIFIDEVHSIVPKSYERGFDTKTNALNTIIKNNKVLGTTATPTAQVRELLGTPSQEKPNSKKPIYDLQLYTAQKILKAVREIDIEDGKPTQKNQLAKEAIKKLLTRRIELKEGMKGYYYPNKKAKDQKKPLAIAKAKNTRLSSQAQGFIFTDDAVTAQKTHALLSELSSINEELNKEASQNRKGEEIDVYNEVIETQRSIIESNIKIDIITNLGVSNKTRKDLQKLVRNGNFEKLDKEYKESVETYQDQQQRKDRSINSNKNKMDSFCSNYDAKIEKLANKKNFYRLRLNKNFNALYLAYKSAVITQNKGIENEETKKQINAFISAVNNNTFDGSSGLYALCHKYSPTGETWKLFSNLFPAKNGSREIMKSERLETFKALMNNEELITKAEQDTFKFLKNDRDYTELFKTYKEAVRINHRNDDEETKKEAIKLDEKLFEQYAAEGKKAELKELFNQAVRKRYTTNWEYKKEIANAPELGNYYCNIKKYFDASNSKHPNTGSQSTIVDSLQKTSSRSELLLDEPKDEKAEKRAKALLEKGMTMYIVSTGPLGTGYSNTNVLSTVVVQEHSIFDIPPPYNPIIKRVQQCGRPIRDDDGCAFGSSVTSDEIPDAERNLTFAQVYGQKSTDDYIEKLEAFEKYWAPTMEKTKELSMAVEDLKETIKKQLKDKNAAQPLADLIDKFDLDIKVKIKAIDKKIQAIHESIENDKSSVKYLDSSIDKITREINTINADALMVILKEKQDWSLQQNEYQKVLDEVTKLQNQQKEQLKSLQIIPTIQASNTEVDEIAEKIKNLEEQIQTAEYPKATLKAIELRTLLKEFTIEKDRIIKKLENEQVKLTNIKQETDWAGLKKIEIKLDGVLSRIEPLQKETNGLATELSKIEELAEVQEQKDNETLESIRFFSHNIGQFETDIGEQIGTIGKSLQNLNQSKEQLEELKNNTSTSAEQKIGDLQQQLKKLVEKAAPENISIDVKNALNNAEQKMLASIKEKQSLLDAALVKLNEAIGNRQKEDTRIEELIIALESSVNDIKQKINEINTAPTAAVNNLEALIANVKNAETAIVELQKQQNTPDLTTNILALPKDTQLRLNKALEDAKKIQVTELPRIQELLKDLEKYLPDMRKIEAYAEQIKTELIKVGETIEKNTTTALADLQSLRETSQEFKNQVEEYLKDAPLIKDTRVLRPLIAAKNNLKSDLQKLTAELQNLDILDKKRELEDKEIKELAEGTEKAIKQFNEQVQPHINKVQELTAQELNDLVETIRKSEENITILKNKRHELETKRAIEARAANMGKVINDVTHLEDQALLQIQTTQTKLQDLINTRRLEDQAAEKKIQDYLSAINQFIKGKIESTKKEIEDALVPNVKKVTELNILEQGLLTLKDETENFFKTQLKELVSLSEPKNLDTAVKNKTSNAIQEVGDKQQAQLETLNTAVKNLKILAVKQNEEDQRVAKLIEYNNKIVNKIGEEAEAINQKIEKIIKAATVSAEKLTILTNSAKPVADKAALLEKQQKILTEVPETKSLAENVQKDLDAAKESLNKILNNHLKPLTSSLGTLEELIKKRIAAEQDSAKSIEQINLIGTNIQQQLNIVQNALDAEQKKETKELEELVDNISKFIDSTTKVLQQFQNKSTNLPEDLRAQLINALQPVQLNLTTLQASLGNVETLVKSQRDTTATKIQSLFRGNQTRKTVKNIRESKQKISLILESVKSKVLAVKKNLETQPSADQLKALILDIDNFTTQAKHNLKKAMVIEKELIKQDSDAVQEQLKILDNEKNNANNLFNERTKKDKEATEIIQNVTAQIANIENEIQKAINDAVFDDTTTAEKLRILAEKIQLAETAARKKLETQSELLSKIDTIGLEQNVAVNLENAIKRVSAVNLTGLTNKHKELDNLAQERKLKDQEVEAKIKEHLNSIELFVKDNIKSKEKEIEEASAPGVKQVTELNILKQELVTQKENAVKFFEEQLKKLRDLLDSKSLDTGVKNKVIEAIQNVTNNQKNQLAALEKWVRGLEELSIKQEIEDKRVADLINKNNEVIQPIEEKTEALNKEIEAIKINKKANKEALDDLVIRVKKLIEEITPQLLKQVKLLNGIIVTSSLAQNVQTNLQTAKDRVSQLQNNHLHHLKLGLKELTILTDKRNIEEKEASKSIVLIEQVKKTLQEKISEIQAALNDPNKKAAELSNLAKEASELNIETLLQQPSDNIKRQDLPHDIKEQLDLALQPVQLLKATLQQELGKLNELILSQQKEDSQITELTTETKIELGNFDKAIKSEIQNAQSLPAEKLDELVIKIKNSEKKISALQEQRKNLENNRKIETRAESTQKTIKEIAELEQKALSEMQDEQIKLTELANKTRLKDKDTETKIKNELDKISSFIKDNIEPKIPEIEDALKPDVKNAKELNKLADEIAQVRKNFNENFSSKPAELRSLLVPPNVDAGIKANQENAIKNVEKILQEKLEALDTGVNELKNLAVKQAIEDKRVATLIEVLCLEQYDA
jgi:DNA repair exonuclease SbcCD ATPase subunit